MDALNTLRAVLVGLAFVAALMLASNGRWVPAAIMGAGIAAHFALWGHLRKQKRQAAEHVALVDGTQVG